MEISFENDDAKTLFYVGRRVRVDTGEALDQRYVRGRPRAGGRGAEGDPPWPAVDPDTPTTIRAGRLIDGAGAVRENARITLDGSRIGRIDRLRGTVTYDLSDFTAMPGLIDTHVHLTAHFDADGRNHSDPDETPEQAILYAAENAYRTLMAGFTTVQSLGSLRDRLAYRVRDGGQDRMDAIISATSRAAESLGLADTIGTIAPGLEADLVAVAANPLAPSPPCATSAS